MPSAEVCAAAARIAHDVTHHGRSLEVAANVHLPDALRRKSETREIAWGAIRWWFHCDRGCYRINYFTALLRKRDRILHSLMICGLYQLDHLNEPDYAVTSGTVDAAALLGAAKAKGLVNAVLRARLRDPGNRADDADPAIPTPSWLAELIRQDWPEDWRAVLSTFNQKPPMSLRVNTLQCSRDDYLHLLGSHGVRASACPLSPWGSPSKHRSMSKISLDSKTGWCRFGTRRPR